MMTEEQVERRIERITDLLDLRLIAGTINQSEYDAAMRNLNRVAEAKFDQAAIWDRVRSR